MQASLLTGPESRRPRRPPMSSVTAMSSTHDLPSRYAHQPGISSYSRYLADLASWAQASGLVELVPRHDLVHHHPALLLV